MKDREITQEHIDKLVDDASYLQDEAEALKYVIENVDYLQSPPDGQSIAEMLLLIDHAQLSYYRPILEEAFKSPRPIHLENFEHFSETFEADEEKLKNIQKILSKLSKHRAGLVNAIENIPLIDWGSALYSDGRELLLYDFMQEMIRFERSKLKDIADLVMVFEQEKQGMRELEKRKAQHAHPDSDQN